MFTRIVLTILLLAGLQCTWGQTYIGRRETINYEKKQYNGGTQNWKIEQDAQGRVYFANNEGVLVFDGVYWQLYPLPNKTIVWSIEFGPDNKLYTGGQDEIGYFAPDKNGVLAFTSLKELLPKADQKFSDVWDIVTFGKDIFFRTRNKIFRYRDGKMTAFTTPSSWLYLGVCRNQLLAHNEQRGLLEYKNGRWQTYIDKSSLPAGFYITGICPFGKDSSIVNTAKNGNYILTGQNLTYWPLAGSGIDNKQHFLSTLNLGNNTFLISTYTNGVYQVDSHGRVMDNISKKDGLQNSNVRCMFMDAAENIWLGLDNGIDMVAYNSSIKQINPSIFKDGGGFSITRYKNSLYFALSNGIYQLPIQNIPDLSYSTAPFKMIAEGLSWHLSIVNDNLLAGRDDGLYKINQDKLQPLSTNPGYWIFEPIPGTTLTAAGNYEGVRLFDEKDDNFINKGNIGSFNESARFLAIDDHNNIWTSHPYRGIYKLTLGGGGSKLYGKAQGLPSSLNNTVFKIRNRMVVATERGIYEYNNTTDRFQSAERYKEIFGTRSLRFVQEDPAGNIWFVEGKNIGVVDLSAAQPRIIHFPELNRRILSGFENIYAVNEQNVFVGGENGFYHINYAKYKQNIRPLNVFIRKVKAISDTDSLLFGGHFAGASKGNQAAASVPALSYLWNSLHFEYASAVFEAQNNVTYSYFLEGFDREWSAWSKKTEKDYTNLAPGTYTFKVKARNHQDYGSAIYSYRFTIAPPWYRTVWAYLFYLTAIGYLLYYFFKRQEKKHIREREHKLEQQRLQSEEEQRQMAIQHRLELEISEKEVVKLRNEKLEGEIEFKNSELATTAMTLVQKKEFILKVKEELQRLQKPGKDVIEAAEIKKVLRLLSEEKKVNEEWEQFSVHFNKVHADFLTVLKERYPAINQQELKLAAYLIMNLSSKEIAQLLAISVRGVEISRYRLRKKLQIPTEVNLFEFLFEIQRDCMK